MVDVKVDEEKALASRAEQLKGDLLAVKERLFMMMIKAVLVCFTIVSFQQQQK